MNYVENIQKDRLNPGHVNLGDKPFCDHLTECLLELGSDSGMTQGWAPRARFLILYSDIVIR
jgi:hypothetical protein